MVITAAMSVTGLRSKTFGMRLAAPKAPRLAASKSWSWPRGRPSPVDENQDHLACEMTCAAIMTKEARRTVARSATTVLRLIDRPQSGTRCPLAAAKMTKMAAIRPIQKSSDTSSHIQDQNLCLLFAIFGRLSEGT